MSEAIIVYALKCEGGYVRATDQGQKVVGLDKASVYQDLERALQLAKEASTLDNVCVVELTISERIIAQ